MAITDRPYSEDMRPSASKMTKDVHVWEDFGSSRQQAFVESEHLVLINCLNYTSSFDWRIDWGTECRTGRQEEGIQKVIIIRLGAAALACSLTPSPPLLLWRSGRSALRCWTGWTCSSESCSSWSALFCHSSPDPLPSQTASCGWIASSPCGRWGQPQCCCLCPRSSGWPSPRPSVCRWCPTAARPGEWIWTSGCLPPEWDVAYVDFCADEQSFVLLEHEVFLSLEEGLARVIEILLVLPELNGGERTFLW